MIICTKKIFDDVHNNLPALTQSDECYMLSEDHVTHTEPFPGILTKTI